MNQQSRLRGFFQRHYIASIVVAFIGGLLASTSSHFLNRIIDRIAFEDPQETFSVSNSTKYFPIEEGNTWVYQGRHDYTIPNSNKVDSKKVTLSMKVLKVHKFPHLVLAEISAWPFDQIWDNNSEERCALVFVGNKVYRIQEPDIIKRISQTGDAFGTLTDEDILFEFPLFKDAGFGESKSLGREDMFYAWHVVEEYDIASSFSHKSGRAYRLAMRTYPDHALLTFQPNVGIIEFEYEHHGTVEKLSLTLSQFIAKRKA